MSIWTETTSPYGHYDSDTTTASVSTIYRWSKEGRTKTRKARSLKYVPVTESTTVQAIPAKGKTQVSIKSQKDTIKEKMAKLAMELDTIESKGKKLVQVPKVQPQLGMGVSSTLRCVVPSTYGSQP